VCHRPLVAWEDVLAADGGAFEIVNRQAGTIWAVATLGRGASGGGALSFRGKYRASLAGPGRSCGATDGARPVSRASQDRDFGRGWAVGPLERQGQAGGGYGAGVST
jgi:hypothetical protein